MEAEDRKWAAGEMGTPPSEVAAVAAEGFPLYRLWGHFEAQWPAEPQYKDRLLSLQRFFSWSVTGPRF